MRRSVLSFAVLLLALGIQGASAEPARPSYFVNQDLALEVVKDPTDFSGNGLVGDVLADVSLPVRITASVSPISLLLTASRTTCPFNPCNIFFDTIGTTDASVTSNPYEDIEYRWNFGDSGAGSWAYGTTLGSKNTHRGPVAAHVFETDGSYTVTLTAYDGTNTRTLTQLVTVGNANSYFGTTNTICVARTVLPVQGADGCPANASVGTNTDIASIVSTYAATGKRILLKHDDTFDCTPASNVCANFTGKLGPGLLGQYGSGATPIISAVAGVTNDQIFRMNSDWTLMDLEIAGNTRHMKAINAGATYNNSLVLRVYMHDVDYGLSYSESVLVSQAALWTNNALVDSHCDAVGYCAYFSGASGAIQGTFMNNVGVAAGTHGVRWPYMYKGLYANNTITTVVANVTTFTIRAQPENTVLGPMALTNGHTKYVQTNDSVFDPGATGNINMTIQPASASFPFSVVEKWIVERCLFKSGAAAQTGLGIDALSGVARNNLFETTSGAAHIGLSIASAALNQYVPNDIRAYNNTCYNNVVGSVNNKCVSVASQSSGAPTNITVKNTLYYAPTATSPLTLSDCCSSTTGGNTATPATTPNLSTTNTTPPLLSSDWKPSGSYAVGGGVAVSVWSDFFLVAQPTPRDIGAVIH